MAEIQSPFLLAGEVETISRMCDVTRTRQEKLGLFPRRFKIGLRKVAYQKAEIEAWARDPEEWVAKNRGAA